VKSAIPVTSPSLGPRPGRRRSPTALESRVAGLPAPVLDEPVAAMPAWRRDYLQAVGGREDEIVATFLRLRSDIAVARQLDLRVTHVRRLIDARVPEAGVLRRARRRSSPLYSDGEMIIALRAAALDLPSPLGIECYRRWAQAGDDVRLWPSPEAIMLRFGGWRRALARSGLSANPHRGPRASYTYRDVVEAIAASWRELRGYPSVVRYTAWRAGRSDVPAAATARRFAKSWDDLLVAAYPLVYPVIGETDQGSCRTDRQAPSTLCTTRSISLIPMNGRIMPPRP